MSFCPKCGSEYINGRAECADCNVPLVESLEELNEEVSSIPEEDTTNELPSDDNVTDDNDITDALSEESKDAPKQERIYSFVSKKDKYKDYLSTGYTFVIVGLLGLVLVTLNYFDIIKIFFVDGASAVLFYVVLYSLFAIFVFIGINSFINSSRIKKESVAEDTYLAEINEYIKANITIDTFNSIDSDLSEEETYFNRTEIIKKIILEKYPDMDSALLEKTLDDTYDQLFS